MEFVWNGPRKFLLSCVELTQKDWRRTSFKFCALTSGGFVQQRPCRVHITNFQIHFFTINPERASRYVSDIKLLLSRGQTGIFFSRNILKNMLQEKFKCGSYKRRNICSEICLRYAWIFALRYALIFLISTSHIHVSKCRFLAYRFLIIEWGGCCGTWGHLGSGPRCGFWPLGYYKATLGWTLYRMASKGQEEP